MSDDIRSDIGPQNLPDAGNDRSYEVGYKKPPKHTQFKPGQPRKRRRRSKQGPVDVAAILDEPITVTSAGTKRKMTAFEISVRKLASRAVNEGDVRAAIAFLELCEKYKIIKPAPPKRPTSGVIVIPRSWDPKEWWKMFYIYGHPPWPGPRSGLGGS